MSSQTLLQKLGVDKLTPVEHLAGIHFKRDDLFVPFGVGSVNGGKLRQGLYLISKIKEQGFNRTITGSSLISAQSPVVAVASKYFGLDCVVFYGGTNEETLFQKHHMPRLVKYYGAEIRIAKSGRSNVLLSEAKKISGDKDFVVEYGINSKDLDLTKSFYESNAFQVQNLPEELDNLIFDCGSGISTAGILYGLIKYKKKVKNVWVVGTAPNRLRKIKDRLSTLALFTGVNCWNFPFNYINLFEDEKMAYEDKFKVEFQGIVFHENYEAKVFDWYLRNDKLFKNQKNCFWIIGGPVNFLKE